ncbi:MAG: hypothetical protein R2827_16720 [Bdellovibrionales bacterium]
MQLKAIDPLFLIFSASLEDDNAPFDSEDEFVAHVVEVYMSELKSAGNLPVQFEDSLREEFAHEVYDMLLKRPTDISV